MRDILNIFDRVSPFYLTSFLLIKSTKFSKNSENNFVKINFQAERDAEQGLTNDSNSQVKFSCPEPEEEQDDEVIIVSKLAVRQQ